MSALSAAVLAALGAWSRAALRWPLPTALISLAAVALGLAMATSVVRASLEQRTDRVAAGPIFALAGLATFAATLLWALTDAALAAAGAPPLSARLLLLLADEPTLRAVLALPADVPVHLRGPAAVPLALALGSVAYLGLTLWAGRTLAELTALEQKPDDVLAKERAEQRKAIEQALKEGRPVPAAEVVSLPLADDLFGRTFKLLGHWTSVERVEERFVRWQRPLVWAGSSLLLLALLGAIGGHLPAALWAGAALAIHGAGRNLRTPPRPPDPPPAEDAAPKQATPPPDLRPVVEAIHRGAGPLSLAPAPIAPSPAQISPGTHLQARRILEDLRRAMGLEGGLYVHQGLACDAFAARRNVLLCTPPLSGRRALLDLLALYAVLVESETVLYIAPSEAEARRAEERLKRRAEAARWHWTVPIENLAGKRGAVDLARAQPALVITDIEALHRELCGRQDDWQAYLGALGLVLLPDLATHHGARGAHLAHALRRLRRAATRARPAAPRGGEGEAIRFVATADPLFRDLGQIAERLVGRPFQVLGPEVDGAPQPDRTVYALPAHAARSDLHPAVHALGEALAHGVAAELAGYEGVLAAADVARANALSLVRGVATRGRAFAEAEGGEAEGEALAGASVVILRASAARWAALPAYGAHLGFRAGAVPESRVAALGAGERVGAAAAPKPPPDEAADEAAPAEGEGAGAALTDEQIAAQSFARKVIVVWQPDLSPLAALLAKERPPPAHPDLKLGCALVLEPLAERVQRAHLRCALAEAALTEEELAVDFAKPVIDAELAALREGGAGASARLVEERRRRLDPAAGVVRDEVRLRLSAGPELFGELALDAAGEPVRVVERRTGEVLFAVERERALAAAYPGRIFVRAGRRFAVLPLERQDALAEGRIACEREERWLTTSRVRRLTVRPAERRAGADRRKDAPDAAPEPAPAPVNDQRRADRRADPRRSLGGAPFTMRTLPVEVEEEVLGLRRHGPDGLPRDAASYPDPIVCRYATRATILGLPRDRFGEVGAATLHALAHLFRETLPAFLHHAEDDLEIARVVLGPGGDDEARLAFVDARPGGVGFADAIDLEVLRHAATWALALARRCSGGCGAPAGCPRCLRITACHAPAEEQDLLDKAGAERVLAALLGG